MSIRALCLGTVDHLRAVFNTWPPESITHERSPRPPAMAGQRHITVCFGGYRSTDDTPEDDDRLFDLLVTIIFKVGYAPHDRQGDEISQEGGEEFLEDIADQMGGLLLNNWTHLELVNGHITGAGITTNGFIEPFMRSSCGAVEEKPSSWFGAAKTNKGTVAGLALTVRLSGARRIRLLETLA